MFILVITKIEIIVKRNELGNVKEAVDYLYGHQMSMKDIYISFYGGEPLLMFRLIKEVE